MGDQLTAITLGGFKGIKTTAKIPLAPITLLFGANSTGKSSILHGLLYLYEILINKNLDPEYSEITGRKIWLGGFKNLVHGKSESGVITIGAEIGLHDPACSLDYFTYGDEDWVLGEEVDYGGELFVIKWRFNLEIAWDSFQKRPFIQLFETFSDGELVSRIRRKSGTPSPVLTYLKFLDQWHRQLGPIDGKMVSEAIDLSSNTELPLKSALPDFDKRLSLPNLPWDWEDMTDADPAHALLCLEAATSMAILAPGQELCKLLKNLLHIGPIRVIPDDTFGLERDYRSERWVDGSGGWDAFGEGEKSLHDAVNECFWGEDSFRADFSFCVSEPDSIGRRAVYLEKMTDDELIHRLTEVGVGVSQVFPVVTAMNLERDVIVSCEQPELHIHPRWQLVLADLMLKSVKGGHQKMFIMETHSEHLMLRLLRRRRETVDDVLDDEAFSCGREDVQVIFCESFCGETRLRPIAITDEGEFDTPWPNGFFGERKGELV